MQESDGMFRVERSNESLRNKTTDMLRKAISGGHFAAGARLVERELCDLTGVSRTIVRESLRHLEAEGLVNVVPNRGPIVATLSPDQVRQIYELREALEPLSAQLFCKHAENSALDDLGSAHQELIDAFASEDVSAIASKARVVFETIYDNCGNEFVADALRRVAIRVDTLRLMSMSRKERLPHSREEMNDIASALLARDTTKAATASLRHVKAAAKAASDAMAKPAATSRTTGATRGRGKLDA